MSAGGVKAGGNVSEPVSTTNPVADASAGGADCLVSESSAGTSTGAGGNNENLVARASPEKSDAVLS
jgi:hypothetical protein